MECRTINLASARVALGNYWRFVAACNLHLIESPDNCMQIGSLSGIYWSANNHTEQTCLLQTSKRCMNQRQIIRPDRVSDYSPSPLAWRSALNLVVSFCTRSRHAHTYRRIRPRPCNGYAAPDHVASSAAPVQQCQFSSASTSPPIMSINGQIRATDRKKAALIHRAAFFVSSCRTPLRAR